MRGLYHNAVEACLHHVGCCDAEVEVDAVDTDKQLAAGEVVQCRLCIFADHRQTAVAEDSAKLDDVDVVVVGKDARHFERCRYHGQLVGRVDVARQRVDCGAGCDENGVARSDQLRCRCADEPFLLHIQPLLLAYILVFAVRVYEDCFTVVAVEFLFFLKLCQVFSYRNR